MFYIILYINVKEYKKRRLVFVQKIKTIVHFCGIWGNIIEINADKIHDDFQFSKFLF